MDLIPVLTAITGLVGAVTALVIAVRRTANRPTGLDQFIHHAELDQAVLEEEAQSVSKAP